MGDTALALGAVGLVWFVAGLSIGTSYRPRGGEGPAPAAAGAAQSAE